MPSHKFEINIKVEGLHKYVGCITNNEEHLFSFSTKEDALNAINNAIGFHIEDTGNRMKDTFPWKNIDFIIIESYTFSD